MDNENGIKLTGKIAKFPNNTKAVKALRFLENVKINPKKLWYIIIEDQGTDLKMVKYNRHSDVNLLEYTNELKQIYLNHYSEQPLMVEALNKITVEGELDFSIIKNIPNVTLESGQTLISKISADLIKLLAE
jgi:hypothetical protein